MFAKVEYGVTKFSPEKEKNAIFYFGLKILIFPFFIGSLVVRVAYKSIDSFDPLLHLHKPN